MWFDAALLHRLIGAGLVGAESETSGQDQRNAFFDGGHIRNGLCGLAAECNCCVPAFASSLQEDGGYAGHVCPQHSEVSTALGGCDF